MLIKYLHNVVSEKNSCAFYFNSLFIPFHIECRKYYYNSFKTKVKHNSFKNLFWLALTMNLLRSNTS